MSENTPLMPDTASLRGRRVVLQHTAGPYSGLHQITGTTDDFGAEGNVPVFTDEPFEVNPGRRMALAGLVAVKPRFVLYREITKPEGLGTFNRSQR